MQQRTMIIQNRLGLHARAAARLVRVAAGFQCDIRLARTDARQKLPELVDAKSIFSVLLLAATQHTEIMLVTEGKDELTAMEALCGLIEEKFGEH